MSPPSRSRKKRPTLVPGDDAFEPDGGGEHHAEAVGHLPTRLEPLRQRQTRETARQLGAELVKV